MNTILFEVKGNRLKRINGFDPVSGENKYTKLRFELDDEWAGVKAATVTMFFDISNSFNVTCEVTDGVAEVDIDENLRNVSGIMWVGITGVDTISGATLDCTLTAVPVGQGTVVTETASTKLYQQIMELIGIIEGKLISEYNQITTSLIQDKAVTPSKLDRAYWEKNAPVSNQILDRSVLFDTVGFVNVGGSIAFLNLDLFVSTDTYTGEVTKINGFCYAMGVKFTSVETVYLINVTDGSMWKINRTNTGDEYVPVYTYDFIRQSVATADIADGVVTAEKIAEGSITGKHIASNSIGNTHLETDSVQNANLVDKAVTPSKLDRAYWEKNAPVSNQILDRSVLFDTVGFVNDGGSIAFLNLDLFVSTDTYTGEVTKINGFCYAMGVKFTSVETVYLINVTDGSMWKINRTNTGDEYVPVYTYDFIRQSVATADIADGAVTEDKLSHRFWHRFGSIPTVGNDSVFASMLSDDCISLIKLSTDTYANMGEGPFAGFPMGDNRYSLINLATGEIWCASKGDEGFAVTSIYTPVKVDSQLSEKSTNAVENRLVTAALNKRLKTLVSTATAADTDVIGSLTDDNYVGLVQSATSDVLSYKFESWRDPIAQTVTQYRTFLSSGVRECRTAQLTDGCYVWGEWTELGTAALDIAVTDEGEYFESEDVEGALQEIGSDLQEIEQSGALVTLTSEQIDALNKMFSLAVYKDDTVLAAYTAFSEAFGLGGFTIFRILNSNEFVAYGVSNLYSAGTDIPYTRASTSTSPRTCYPYFDIVIDSDYTYEVDFEANEGVEMSLEFYNETALASIEANEDFAQTNRKYTAFSTSKVSEFTPPVVNGLPAVRMRISFNSSDAGVKEVIIYRKKVE